MEPTRSWLVLLLMAGSPVACGPVALEHGSLEHGSLEHGSLEHEHGGEVGVLRQSLAGNPLRRPHWGSVTHGDGSGSQWASGKFPYFTAPRWPGCHKTTCYLLDSSLPASWKPQVRAAFAAWDQPAYCSPHWVGAEASAADRWVLVGRRGDAAARRGHSHACTDRSAPRSSAAVRPRCTART